MSITDNKAPWLLLVFSLTARHASRRVEVWRKLQRYGAVRLRNSGYLLPNNPANHERFEWLASAIRSYKGEASVVEVRSIDNLSFDELKQRFAVARSNDFQALIRDLQKFINGTTRVRTSGLLSRLRKRHQELSAIDFFNSPLRSRIDELLERAGGIERGVSETPHRETGSKKSYRNRTWVTRPRPGIDRSASAWLIRRYIDPRARFVFAADPSEAPAAIPYDMFDHGFGHRGEDCTFETLLKEFRIRDRKAATIAQMVHDADLCDDKYGRKEAFGVEEVLKGWAKQEVTDQELLKRGMEMIEGLYHSLP